MNDLDTLIDYMFDIYESGCFCSFLVTCDGCHAREVLNKINVPETREEWEG